MNFKDFIRKLFSKEIFGGKHTSDNAFDEAIKDTTSKNKIHKHDDTKCHCKKCAYYGRDTDCVEDEDGLYEVVETYYCELGCPEFDYEKGRCECFI